MKRFLSFVVFFLILINNGFATHIVGGDFVYRWVGGNNFEFKLNLYRDCLTGQAGFDQSIVIGVFDKVTNVKLDTLEIFLQYDDTVQLNGPSANCVIPPEVCVETGVYIDTLLIPNNPNGYYVVWERCCRNNSIVNIIYPLGAGITYYLEMPNPALHNSSPYFLSDPLPFICEGQPLNYSFAATDPDGDVLVYELSTPLQGNSDQSYPILPTPVSAPYPNIQWAPGYSLSNVCGSQTNPLTVNPVTGMISVTVETAGMYAMAVLVKEYRNGILIGKIRREIEFTVVFCIGAQPTISNNLNAGGSGSGFPIISSIGDYDIYETDTLSFNFNVSDQDDSLWLTVTSELFPGGSITSPYATAPGDTSFLSAQSQFNWRTTCGKARATPYYVAFKVEDNGCPLPSTIKDTVWIKVHPVPIDTTLDLLCLGLRNNDSIVVVWTQDADIPARYFSRYDIYRSKNGGPFSVVGSVNSIGESSFTDLNAGNYLFDDYCYYMRAVSSCGTMSAHSDTVCSVSQFNTKINYIKSVSVPDSGLIRMEWKNFPDGPYSTFYIYRKENNPASSFELTETLYQPNYNVWVDKFVETSSKSYCYYLENEDVCGNVSPQSNEGCTILLNGKSEPYASNLSWNAYRGWNKVKQYEIYRKPFESLDFSALNALPDSNYLYIDDELDLNSGRFCYYVRALEDTGSFDAESISNEIELTQVPIGFLPAAFTPNDDGRNDVWNISSSFIKTLDIKVFNRWGIMVFATTNKHDLWDGTFKGKKAPLGTYVYTLKFSGYESDDTFERTGRVTVIR